MHHAPGYMLNTLHACRCTGRSKSTRRSVPPTSPPTGSSSSWSGGTSTGEHASLVLKATCMTRGTAIYVSCRWAWRVKRLHVLLPAWLAALHVPLPACPPCRFFALKHGSRMFQLHGTHGPSRQWTVSPQALQRWKEGQTGERPCAGAAVYTCAAVHIHVRMGLARASRPMWT